MTTPNDSLRFVVGIDATPAAVYHALIDPDALTEWLAESAEVDLGAGRYEFWGRYTPQGDRARQHLLGHDDGRGLRYSWELDGSTSTVEVAIAAANELTEVAVTHAGLVGDATPIRCFWYVSLSNLAAHCEGLPTTPPFDFAVPAQGDALVRTVIDIPVEQVYACLLDAEQVSRWIGAPAVIEPKVGGRYEFPGSPHGPVSITEMSPEKTLAYSWRHPDGPATAVRWQLRDSRGSTYLTLVHSGFRDDRMAEDARQRWLGRLVELKRLLELGGRWQPMAR